MMHRDSRVSLVEILIGALAAAFLFSVAAPALRTAGEAAELTKCRANLYEIGQAVFRYAADHDGMTPPNINPATGTPAMNWGTYVEDRSYGFLLAQRDGGIGVADYIGKPHFLFCPSLHPAVWENPSYRHPDDISETHRMIRTGYIWVFYPSDSQDFRNRSNAHVTGDPHRVLMFDFGWTRVPGFFGWNLPSHAAVMNVLHLGGHVTTAPLDEANEQPGITQLYDWLTARSAGVPPPRP